MGEIKNIIREHVPCWYELSFLPKTSAIMLRVHKDFIASQKEIPQNAPIVEHFKKEFGFETFVGSFNKSFGFDGVFGQKKENGEFVEFLIKIPQVKKKTDKICDYCKGSGKDPFMDRECVFCHGEGFGYRLDWKPAYAISASLNIFFSFARFPETETGCSLSQLMTVEIVTRRGAHGASLNGEYGKPLVQWLSSLESRSEISEMVKVMKITYDCMLGLETFHENSFSASVDHEGGWLNISCPGDACGLNPNSSYLEKGKGYKFSCHNVDSPMQQITLLAGLASLHDRARKEIK